MAGIQICAVDYDQAIDRVMQAAEAGEPLSVSALAVHGVMTGVLDPEHAQRLNALDLVVPDGQPVRWALNGLHQTGLKDRVYGPELTLRLCQAAARKGVPVYFYGSKTDVLNQLERRLKERFPALEIAGMQPSKFRQLSADENAAMVDEILASGASLVFVGLGCPRQEVWAFENTDALSVPVLAVGAAFDFHAGLLKQAPPWMQKRGLEWVYRLAMEPRRLWKRYLYLNPLFCWEIAKQVVFRGVRDDVAATEPSVMRYG
ncbi:MAG: WecB/TagA/CpsF family glycosyltransferase [Pseudomonadota bacterium]